MNPNDSGRLPGGEELDLDAIRADLKVAVIFADGSGGVLANAAAKRVIAIHLPALLAEVERLRASLSGSGAAGVGLELIGYRMKMPHHIGSGYDVYGVGAPAHHLEAHREAAEADRAAWLENGYDIAIEPVYRALRGTSEATADRMGKP